MDLFIVALGRKQSPSGLILLLRKFLYRLSDKVIQNKRDKITFYGTMILSLFYILCGRRDLNPHRYTPTAPSRQRVCHSATTAQCM